MFFITIKLKALIIVIMLATIVIVSYVLLVRFSPLSNRVRMLPEQVIQEHFKWKNEKDVEKTEKMLIEGRKGIVWMFENLEYIKIISIREEKTDFWIKRQIRWAKSNGLKLDNVKIYSVEFDVKYINDEVSISKSGKDRWHYYLIRKDKNSPWLIADWGVY
jgi:hypothetical protein